MYVVIFLVLVLVGAGVMYRVYPPFGGKSQSQQWLRSKNFSKTIFVNQIPTSMMLKVSDIISIVRERLNHSTLRRPKTVIESEKVDLRAFLNATTPQIVWLGHSTVLMRINGKTIITDPIFSKRASPFSFAGPKRVISTLSLTAEQLPPIDAVLISHDHYDHLDYATVRALAKKTKKFLVPLGVAAHLQTWHVKPEQIEELDWWKSAMLEDITITCTPSRHFSGRTLGDRFKTLWCSWVIHAPDAKIYFSGDTGYGPHFKEIGAQHGPFDLTLMECGQYNTRWPNVHMMPEDTVRAHKDLGGKKLLPVHWGAFALALHDWRDSVRRATVASQAANVELVTVKLGEVVAVSDAATREKPWWNE